MYITHVHTHAQTHTHIHTYTHMHKHTHIYAHTHTHTCTHTHIHTQSWILYSPKNLTTHSSSGIDDVPVYKAFLGLANLELA